MSSFSFTHVWSLFCLSSIASSTMFCDKLFHVSIERCLRSVTSRTGVWYTIMRHLQCSTVDRTKTRQSPALYNPTTPSRPMATSLAPVNFQNTIWACLATLAYWMIPAAAWRYWRLNDPFAVTLQRPVQRRLPMHLNGPDNPRKLPLPLGDLYLLSNTWFHGPTRVFIQNGMSIGSAVFAQRTAECLITLQWASRFPHKIYPFPWEIGSAI